MIKENQVNTAGYFITKTNRKGTDTLDKAARVRRPGHLGRTLEECQWISTYLVPGERDNGRTRGKYRSIGHRKHLLSVPTTLNLESAYS